MSALHPKLASSIVAAALLAAPVSAQTPSPAKGRQAPAKSAVPRASNGKPDLTGVWQAGTNRRGTWEEANAGNGLGGTGTDPSAPALISSATRQTREGAPYQPWAAKKVLESYNIRAVDDPAAQCLPAGIPRLNSLGLFPLQILQTPQAVVFLYEYGSLFRLIPLNAKHPDDIEPSYLGDAVGHWEGDTLVVDTIGFNDKTWLLGAGTFHSEALHMTERFTRVDKDQINYDVVMEDPKVLTKPWEFHTNFMLREGTRLREYVCVENNLDTERIQKYIKEGVKFGRE
jgi:hypothetical protein